MLSGERARLLAAYGRDRRGWDEPGSMAQLRKVAHLNEDDVALAWVRLCADVAAKTPGAFPNLNGPHWRERGNTSTETQRMTPAAARCNDCGKPEIHPLHPSDHPFERLHEHRVVLRVDELRAALRGDADDPRRTL